MKYEQIAGILNDVYDINAKDGASANLSRDLSNVVDFGRTIVSGTTTLNAQFLTLANVIDKIRKTIYIDAEFVGTAPKCFVDDSEMNGLKEVMRVSVGSFDNNTRYDVFNAQTTNSFNDLFGKVLPTVNAKYYGKVVTYRQKITETYRQFEAAFKSPSALSQFFAHVENAIRVKYDWSKDTLQYITFNNAVIEKLSSTHTSSSDPCVKTLASGNTFVDFINTVKSITREMLAFNRRYSAFETSTPKSRLHMAVRADYYDKMITALYDVRQPEYLNIPLDNIHVVPYFQFADDPDKISMATPSTVQNATDSVDKLLAVIYDERAFGCTARDEKVTSQYVANEDVTNFFHMAEFEYIVNSDLPLVCICENGGGFTKGTASSGGSGGPA
jgi:hypothetical protein